MPFDDLLLEKDGPIATITLNAPEKLNALTAKMRQGIPLAAKEVEQDDSIRVVILTGAGRAFCAGADISMMKARLEGGLEQSRHARLQVMGWPFADVFPRLGKPVIAAVNGVCVGGGFSLALGCDMRIASDTARFGAMQMARALVPDYGITYLLPAVVGMSRAFELMLTAQLISAAEAEKLGIVSRVVPGAELMKAARDLAARIAEQAPIPVELVKKMVWRGRLDALDRQLDLETWAQHMCFQTEDHKESVRAFLEKRPVPPFKGK